MKITIAKVQELNPCKSRFDNFVNNNPNFNGTIEDFLSLENITYSDKIWVCVRLMTKNQKFFWARSIAFSVLEILEKHRPDEKRVKALFDFINSIDDITNLTPEQLEQLRILRDAAWDARIDAYAATAYAATATAYDYAATAATAATAYAAARVQQEEFNLIILCHIMQLDI